MLPPMKTAKKLDAVEDVVVVDAPAPPLPTPQEARRAARQAAELQREEDVARVGEGKRFPDRSPDHPDNLIDPDSTESLPRQLAEYRRRLFERRTP